MIRKGFTLVELLAVITLIGVLGLLTVPIINTTIKNSRQKAFKETLNQIIDAAKIYNADTDYLELQDGDKIDVLSSKLKYENKSEITSGELEYDSGKYFFNYITSKYYCAQGYIESIHIYDITSSECDNL